MRRSKTAMGFVLAAALIFIIGQAIAMEAPRMTKEELRGMMGKPEVIIIDVRSQSDWDGSKEMIQGAVREDYRKIKEWAGKYPKDKTIVFYCA